MDNGGIVLSACTRQLGDIHRNPPRLICAGPGLVFNPKVALTYFVVFAQQALQRSARFGQPNFRCRGFFPLLDESFGLLIKVYVGTKGYREQLFNLL